MSSRYIQRVVDQELDELLPQLPAIALEGSKGVGKTETARHRAGTMHELDDPAQPWSWTIVPFTNGLTTRTES